MNAGLLWGLPFALQGLAMLVDEFGCHRRRPVPRWEWLGHALDTLVFLACAAVPALLPPTPAHLRLFAGLALASCLVIGKDEWVHQRFCPAGEHWLHAVLFSLHPLVLVAMACLWTGSAPAGLATPPWARDLLRLEAVLAAGFLVLQLVHGRFLPRPPAPEIDNGLYEDLGERWYTATDDPVALLRAESRLLAGWVQAELAERGGGRPQAVLDVACGAGFLANPLAAAGHAVTGIDLSPGSLAVARAHDRTGTVNYLAMDARVLSFPDEHFDVVCMMDFLEHLDDRGAVLGEAARVLRPGGALYFHTFNRTAASWLVALKGVRWFVRNTPEHLHVFHLFLKPAELRRLCAGRRLALEALRGVRPRVGTGAFLQLLCTGRVSHRFRFRFTRYQGIGYCGRARKTA